MINKKYRILVLAGILTVSLFGFSACQKNEEKDIEEGQIQEYSLETIEEQVLFDESGVKVTANEMIASNDYGKGILLTFENNTDKTLTFDCKKMIINGIMAPELFGNRVNAGETSEMSAYFGTTMLEYLGIDNVGEIQIEFDCYTSDDYKSIYRSDLVSVKTSAYEEMDKNWEFDGEKLYEDNGIVIYGKMASDDVFSHAMLLYVENTTDSELLFKSNGITIDSEYVEYLYVFNVCEDSNKLFYLEFGDTDSEESTAEPEPTEELGTDYEMDFEIYDRAELSLIGNTGALKVSMK